MSNGQTRHVVVKKKRKNEDVSISARKTQNKRLIQSPLSLEQTNEHILFVCTKVTLAQVILLPDQIESIYRNAWLKIRGCENVTEKRQAQETTTQHLDYVASFVRAAVLNNMAWKTNQLVYTLLLNTSISTCITRAKHSEALHSCAFSGESTNNYQVQLTSWDSDENDYTHSIFYIVHESYLPLLDSIILVVNLSSFIEVCVHKHSGDKYDPARDLKYKRLTVAFIKAIYQISVFSEHAVSSVTRQKAVNAELDRLSALL